MVKAHVLVLKPATMTCQLTKKKAEGTEIQIDKDRTASFTPGLSQFREEISKIWGFIPRPFSSPRTFLIYLEGAVKCFELKSPLKVDPGYWTDTEKKKFIRKLVAKSKAEQKPMSNLQFIGLAGIGVAIIVILMFIAFRLNIF